MSYQGKFSSNNRQPRFSDEELQPKAAPRKAKPVRETNDEELSVKKSAPRKEVYGEERPVKKQASKKEVYEEDVPVKKTSKKSSKKSSKKKKKANRTVTTIFYTLYFLMIIGFFGGMFFVMEWLDGWLVDYEASQPTAKCEEVFNRLFADPDWVSLYQQSGLEDTAYEGAEDYAAYMDAKVGDTQLTYAETSAGLTGGHKYYVKLGDETLGYFTLTDQSENLTDLPDWQLNEVVLNVTREESVLVQSLDGHTVYVNGVALDNSQTIMISTTQAEYYLPAGTNSLRTRLSMVDGLLTEPEIMITDETGAVSTVVYDEENGMYVEQTTANSIGPEEKEVAQLAAETYALYMIEEAGGRLSRYFDTSSQIYKTITSMQLWMQGHSGYEFANQTVSEYNRYTEDLFSARVSLSLNVKRNDGSVKEYTVDTTFFFEKQNGSWKCFDMTNEDVQEPIATVRLTFMNGDAQLHSDFYENDVATLEPPAVSTPEGKVFTGWCREDIDENGVKTLTLVFTPDENGIVTIPAGTTLEPMTLYALFEDTAGNGGAE